MSSKQNSYGLKEEWTSVEETLLKIIPVYDKVNRYISLGRDLKLRKEGLQLLEKAVGVDSTILDLGSGPGKMSELLRKNSIMVDALVPMMRVALQKNKSSDGFIAVYENLPFKEASVGAAMAGFAIRDARNLDAALHEVSRILARSGYFLIVDLSKPDSDLKRSLIGIYWSVFAPMIAFVAAGRLGLEFAALSKTFKKLPTNSKFLEIAKSAGLDLSSSKYHMLSGASVILLKKS
ncbi:MAG: class I SAM-dependent methyltransferase [Nitrososphaerales archaeon]